MLHYILLVSLKDHVINEVYKEQKRLSNETQEDLLDTAEGRRRQWDGQRVGPE